MFVYYVLSETYESPNNDQNPDVGYNDTEPLTQQSNIIPANNNHHKYKFVSYDQSEEFLEKTIKIIPKNLQKKIEFRYSPLKIEIYNNILMSFYSDLEILDYDFIYEDRHDHEKTKIAGDGMEMSVDYYKKNIKKKYDISNSFFHGTNFINKNTK